MTPRKLKKSSAKMSVIFNCHQDNSMAGDVRESFPFLTKSSIQNKAVPNAVRGRSRESRDKQAAFFLKIHRLKQ